MIKNNIDRLKMQLDFLLEIDKVKDILRQSLVNGYRQENDAEHSWHMAMCAYTLKEYFIYDDVNMEKAINMILIHDIVEIYAGDVPAFSNYSKDEKFKNELESAKKIFSMLPNDLNEKYLNLFLEFEKCESVEAKFAAAFDKFQGFMQNLTSDGHTWKKFSPTKEKVLDRMKNIKDYLPFVYENIVLPTIEKYKKLGIIK